MSAALHALAAEHGTPLFVYDEKEMVARARAVTEALAGQAELRYASKANGHQGLLAALRPEVAGVDVTCIGALETALAAGFSGSQLSFTSPGKSRQDLLRAAEVGATLVLGGLDEVRELASLRADGLRPPPLLLRVNPSERVHAFRSATGGLPSPFGVPEEELDAALPELLALSLCGLHVHRGSQCTSVGGFMRHVDGVLALAVRLERAGLPLQRINLGGGLGVAPVGAEPLSLAGLGSRLARTLSAFSASRPGLRFELEPGRYLVGEAGRLLLRVLRRREVRGVTFLVLDGGIDVFLFASERMRHGPPPPIHNLSHPGAPMETVTLVGPACTAEDTLVVGLSLPRAEPGDLLRIEQAGAYAAGASLRGFLGRAPAKELLLRTTGSA